MNRQPVEPTMDESDEATRSGSLDVVKVWRTIQGEGPYAGRPAIFVRLAGCNLQCPKCDTDYTSERKLMSVSELVGVVAGFYKFHTDIVVITGGEPFRQNLIPFVVSLSKWEDGNGVIQIETNGTVYPPEFPWHLVTVVCSPKGSIHYKLVNRIAALKYVIQAGDVDESDGLPIHTLGRRVRVDRPSLGSFSEVYVQPLDEQDEEKNKANLAATLKSCERFGYRLCLQLHKIIGLE